jgi:hypothetical protein
VSVQLLVVIAIAVLFLAILAGRQIRFWYSYRGQRVVTCPESQKPVGVVVDAVHAAVTSVTGQPQLRLTECSRWPERAGCGQPCLGQIAVAPEDCLVRNILSKWYEGKTCACCGRRFEHVEWNAAKPALMKAEGVSADWSQIPAETLRDTLATARPVCFACHTATKMVREHPELVVDRSIRRVT